MIPRTAGEIASAVSGEVVLGPPGVLARGVSIDSRSARDADLFIAIRGPRQDGHRFAAAAVKAGASVVLADRELAPELGATMVRVADTTEALARLARDERAKRRMDVVAITGSSGKTSTRELTGAALSARFRTGTSAGNLNNHWGLPLSLLRLDPETEVAVLEMGMNHAGEIAALTRIASPTVGVITNVGSAHLGFFQDERSLASAKVELLVEMPDDATGVINADGPYLVELARATGRPFVRFGFAEGADVRAVAVTGDLESGMRFEVDGEPVRLKQWGRHAVSNALAALAAAQVLGVSVEEAAPKLAEIPNPPGRGRLHTLKKGGILVDDSYNANPAAVEQILKTLAEFSWSGPRVAVLGDMLELGDHAARLHRSVGETAGRCGIDVLLAVGGFAEELAAAARRAGVGDVEIHDAADSAADALTERISGDELVLVKGSRGVRLEGVVTAALDRYGVEVGR